MFVQFQTRSESIIYMAVKCFENVRFKWKHENL